MSWIKKFLTHTLLYTRQKNNGTMFERYLCTSFPHNRFTSLAVRQIDRRNAVCSSSRNSSVQTREPIKTKFASNTYFRSKYMHGKSFWKSTSILVKTPKIKLKNAPIALIIFVSKLGLGALYDCLYKPRTSPEIYKS